MPTTRKKMIMPTRMIRNRPTCLIMFLPIPKMNKKPANVAIIPIIAEPIDKKLASAYAGATPDKSVDKPTFADLLRRIRGVFENLIMRYCLTDLKIADPRSFD